MDPLQIFPDPLAGIGAVLLRLGIGLILAFIGFLIMWKLPTFIIKFIGFVIFGVGIAILFGWIGVS